MRFLSPATVALIFATGFSGPAAALRQNRTNFQTAANNCQATLPGAVVFRSRPLGILNEGSRSAFISCGLSAEVESSTGINTVFAVFSNRGPVPASVSCTLVDGVPPPLAVPNFFTKTMSIPPGTSSAQFWDRDENGGTNFHFVSISCALPPAVEINFTQTHYDTDVGP